MLKLIKLLFIAIVVAVANAGGRALLGGRTLKIALPHVRGGKPHFGAAACKAANSNPETCKAAGTLVGSNAPKCRWQPGFAGGTMTAQCCPSVTLLV